MGLLDRIRQGLQKTRQVLNTDIRDLFKSQGRLVDDAFLEELFARLVKTDIGPAASREIVEQVRSDFRARVVEMADVVATIKTRLKGILAQAEEPPPWPKGRPYVVMVVGVNGSGKTTSIAKLARLYQSQGKKVLLGAGDTFRAAAVEQLTIWAERLGVEIVKGASGSDPASVAYTALDRAIRQGCDVCIVDTAGRLQNQQHLMQELTKIHRVLGKLVPEAPDEVLLVIDATTGQHGISQAKGFTEAVRCTGLVLAKLDGTAKGGVVVPIRQQVGLPVRYIGVGEKADDLEPFDAQRFVDALFDEGA